MLTPEKIAEARRLCEAATPGPWRMSEDNALETVDCIIVVCAEWDYGDDDSTLYVSNEDAEFIVAARQLVPELLDTLEAETKRADNLQIDFDHACHRLEYANHYSTERDRYKARCEALERSIMSREANTTVLCHACYTCTHERHDVEYCGEKCGHDRRHWQFDEARFAGGD